MCTTCGCNGDGATLHTHHADDGHDDALTLTPEVSHVAIEQDILSRNDHIAAHNRHDLAHAGVFALNLMSSPGAGKTTLLVKTIERLAGRLPVAVIEGDQQTSRDAERIRATGAPALQINTGKGCHLDARMVQEALPRLPLQRGGLLMIENVGNLVCPAAFDLGEAHKVVIFSVTEGEDKPLKYPDMFRAADLVLLNKCDLLPYLEFDADLSEANARRVHPGVRVMRVSATSGEGLDEWLTWLTSHAELCAQSHDHSHEHLHAHGHGHAHHHGHHPHGTHA